MNYEDFLEAEHQLHINTDKVYREHLKKMEILTKRQVTAQESLVKHLEKVLSNVPSPPNQKDGEIEGTDDEERHRFDYDDMVDQKQNP